MSPLVEEALHNLQTELRATMAKTDMKVASEGGEQALAIALRTYPQPQRCRTSTLGKQLSCRCFGGR